MRPGMWTFLGFLASLGIAACGGIVLEGSDGGGDGAARRDGSGAADGRAGRPVFAPLLEGAVGKVDLLFDIDNSASMGDKQSFLAAAVPDLINRLTSPNCLDDRTRAIVARSTNGICPGGSSIEFPPVSDLHIGVISSSLGPRGVTGPGAVCEPSATTGTFQDGSPAIPDHNDDRGELLNRTPGSGNPAETEGTSAAAGAQHFLDWFPTGPGWAVNDGKSATGGAQQVLSPQATPIASAAALESDFAALVIGVHGFGCGIESQLESWYRFLVQPDPYESIVVVHGQTAAWRGVDRTIIQQRHDFLRPDSIVAIIDLTDENDSEIDVRSFGGQAYKFMNENFQPPRGTSACASDPGSPSCTSCAYDGHSGDPSCRLGPYSEATDWGFYINVRHVHMQEKYGIVPQFPLARYVLGLSSPAVPDRDHEYPPGAQSYQGGTVYAGSPPALMDPQDLHCTNPLFARSLPDGSDLSPSTLCNLSGAGGTRTPSQVFYAHIGGVPHELLQTHPGDGVCPATASPRDCPQKDTLSDSDWATILGAGWRSPPPLAPNPGAYDYAGIDPHMIEDYKPREGVLTLPFPNPGGGGADPINGGDWVTDTVSPEHLLPVDREYACIFPLVDPMSGTPMPRDCANATSGTNPLSYFQCDCELAGLPRSAVPSVCGLTDPSQPYAQFTNDYTTQYYAKAYPTVREIQLARLMGTQGVLSSICPIHTTFSGGPNDPLFGYRPAMTTIIDRLGSSLASRCLPKALPIGAGGDVPCSVLVTLIGQPAGGEATLCDSAQRGLSVPDGALLTSLRKEQHAAWVAAGSLGPDPSSDATCVLHEIPYVKGGSCNSAGSPGWCYVTAPSAGTCAQAIAFAPGAPPPGALLTLACTP